LKSVLAKRPTDADAVTLYAWLNNEFLIRGFDVSDDRLALARRYAEQAAVLAPQSAEAAGALGFYFMRGGDLSRSEQLLRRAIALDPREPKYYRLLGWTLLRRGKGEDALQLLEQAVALFPKDVLVRYDLAGLQTSREDYPAPSRRSTKRSRWRRPPRPSGCKAKPRSPCGGTATSRRPKPGLSAFPIASARPTARSSGALRCGMRAARPMRRWPRCARAGRLVALR